MMMTEGITTHPSSPLQTNHQKVLFSASHSVVLAHSSYATFAASSLSDPSPLHPLQHIISSSKTALRVLTELCKHLDKPENSRRLRDVVRYTEGSNEAYMSEVGKR